MAQIQQTAMDDSAIASVEANGFYQTPNSMAIKAIRSKLTLLTGHYGLICKW